MNHNSTQIIQYNRTVNQLRRNKRAKSAIAWTKDSYMQVTRDGLVNIVYGRGKSRMVLSIPREELLGMVMCLEFPRMIRKIVTQ